MTPASDLCEGGLCVTFDNGVNGLWRRDKDRRDFFGEPPSLEAGALEAW